MSKLTSRAVLLIGLVALVAVAWWLLTREPPAAAAGGRPPYVLPVTLADVTSGELEPRADLTGTVATLHRSRIGFELPGRIESIAVEAGDVVEAGALLARLDQRDAEANLARSSANLELAQRELEEVQSGVRDEEKRRLEAELQARTAEAVWAEKEVERGKGLLASAIVSQAEYDSLVAKRDAAQALARAAQEALQSAQAGSRPEQIAIERAEVELRRAELAIAQRQLEKSEIRAPFRAAVVARLASLGDSIAAGTPVVELIDLSRREIELQIPSEIAVRLGAKPRAAVRLEEYVGFTFQTELDAVVAAADVPTRSFRGLIRLAPDEDPEQKLKPGMFVRVEVELEALRGALLVPFDAVRVVASGKIVVKAKPGEPPANGSAPGAAPAAGHGAGSGAGAGAPPLVAEWVPVRVLASAAGRSAVEPLSGSLLPGDRVVVIGADLAFPGAPLLPREATPSPEPAKVP